MINKEEFLRLCKLSHLEFTSGELSKLMKDVDNIIKFSDKVCECQDSSIHVGSFKNFKHHENAKPEYEKCTREQILSGGNNKNGFFFVKNCSK